ncbi:type VII secretion protein EccCb [Amycolatopsis sp. OK19-0408]|uniref:Type VII secretion protein EccCb n=1 Tax=Amycolatopsis iheyensis TaxID=2945988 RepID=A0A9X2NDJ0_9PSEU|nr:type VII secretion protein EccCb [Amycolatopsis iheyensis]MCR6484982.1 type VII secretion protein EccCb [Amycolatopsis iheyensis]
MGRRLALLVATSRYVDPKLPNLRAPVQETQQLAQLLQDPAIGEFDTVSVVLDNRKSLVEYEMEKLFGDCSPDDLVLLYISGHGIKNADRQLFFATNDTESHRPWSTAVPATLVHSLLRECPARNKAVLLDCCYSGIALRLPAAKSESRVEIVDSLGKGTYIMTATNAVERAYEDEKLVLNEPQPFSIFTDAVIKGLSGGVAARGDADVITAEDLYTYVYDELRRRDDADRIQLPSRYNTAEGSFKIANVKSRRLIVDEYAESPRLEELLASPGPAVPGALVVPIGQAYRSGRPGDDVLRVNFTGQDGHIGVVGKIWSGKSVLVRTMLEGLRAGNAPGEVAFYCFDSGGQFSGLSGPEVREVVSPFDGDRIERLLGRIDAEITRRHKLFRAARLNDFAQFRRVRELGKLPPGDNADLFVVVDGWDQFDEEVPGLRQAMKKIAGSGLDMGVHVVVTARHWAEIPAEIERLLGARIELVLTDPAESKLDPELAATLPDRVGWGLYNGKRFLTALPGRPDSEADLQQIIATLESAAFTGEPVEAPDPLLSDPSLLELLGIPGTPATFDIQQAWRRRPIRQRYRVPFGVGEDGRPVELDLKESAQEGMGPHGLCVGATGSGKSEFLRTLMLGLLTTHSPAELNAVLIDFKGGATFRGLERAPHVSAVITNLADDVALLDRAQEALLGEMNRRQEVLRQNGGHQNVWKYNEARENGAGLDPLPALFIVVDEFAELLVAKPDFVDVFVAIGRVGRSLGMYLLLSSQRLEEGRLRGLDTHLSYRIALRTLSASESRSVINVPDAYELPRIPGSGYLRIGTDDPVRFKTAYVSDPLPVEDDAAAPGTELDVVVSRLAELGPPAHEVWLPPLRDPYPLDALLPDLGPTGDRGLSPAGFAGAGRLQVPLGIIDRPYEQRRDPLWADFSGAAGHGVIVGGPQSGKSTMLRTLILSTALTHTPAEAQFYCLDLGGGGLAALADLPHVGGVAVARREPDKARRIVAELTALLSEREGRFRELGIDSMTEFRARKRRGEIGPEQDPFGDAFLIVDNWRALRDDFEELEATITRLAALGLSYGIHVVLAANRWADIRPAVKDLLGTRFELRLGDPTESDIDRRTAVKVPPHQPGRGLSREKLHMLTCLPRIDGSSDPATTAAGTADAVTRIKAAWTGPAAPEVRLLPQLIDYDDLLEADTARDTRLIPIGVDEEALQPVYLDFNAEPHFYAFADGESGKTNLLRQIARGIAERYTPKEAVILLVDYRRTMLGYLQGDALLGYAVSSTQLEGMISDVHGSMQRRLPGPDITQEQLRNRSWWTGPELFILVDDYDLVATSTSNPLRPLAEFLPQAKDVGLHLVVVRRAGGGSKALYDPIIGKLREVAQPGLVMNGSREEGALVGTVRAGAMPPGRGTLVSRKFGKQLIQVSWIDQDAVVDPRPAETEVGAEAKG